MREDYHIYYEYEEELSVCQPEIKMNFPSGNLK